MHYFNVKPVTAVAAVAFLSALPTAQAAGLYTKGSAVVQVDAKNYDRLIAKSNHTSVSYHWTWLEYQVCNDLVTNRADHTRLSSFMRHGAVTARTCNLPMRRLPKTLMGWRRSLPSTVTKTRTNSYAV
jgi:hypothetical protein